MALPPVDLETGDTSGELIEVNRSLLRGGVSFSFWVIVALLLTKVDGDWLRKAGISFRAMVAASAVLLGLHLLLFIIRPSMFGGRFRFKMSVNPQSEKKARRGRWILLACMFASIAFMLIPVIYCYWKSDIRLMMKLVFPVCAIAIAMMTGATIWQSRNLPKTRLKGFKGNYLQITVSSPEALSYLRLIEAGR